MGSITDVEAAGACDTCARRTDNLHRRAGDDVCEQCVALLTAAHALLDNNVVDEPAVLGTLAFAWSKDTRAVGPEDYGGLEFLSSVDGVPLLRLPRITADVVTYDGSHIPKAARIDVYSRDVTRQEFAEVYERLLKDHGIHFDKFSAGPVYIDTEDAKLTLTVRAMKELHPDRVPLLKSYPAGRIYSFLPPMLVSGFYGELLGSTDKRTFSGYAYALAESGRHTPQKAVTGGWPGCGAKGKTAQPHRESDAPASRRRSTSTCWGREANRSSQRTSGCRTTLCGGTLPIWVRDSCGTCIFSKRVVNSSFRKVQFRETYKLPLTWGCA
jgi:hypothetical protein